MAVNVSVPDIPKMPSIGFRPAITTSVVDESHLKLSSRVADTNVSQKNLEDSVFRLMTFKMTIEEKRSEIETTMKALAKEWCDEDVSLYLKFILSIRRNALVLQLKRLAKDAKNQTLSLFLNICESKDRPDEIKPAGISPEVSNIICKQAEAFAKENNSLIKLLKEFNNEDEVDGFGNLKRFGATGEIAMHTVPGSEELIPKGSCLTMTDLLQRMHINPDIHKPDYAAVKVIWDSKGKQLVFADSFDGVIPSVTATCHKLQYYNCQFATESQRLVQVLYESEIQTFNYSKKYLNDYIEKKGGGPGLERHPFPHMDCPNSENSGRLVLGKFVDKEETELHLTAFEVPKGEIVYIPGNVIHTNDYFLGKWHTMLSGETDVDLVHLVKGDQKKAFHFSWSK